MIYNDSHHKDNLSTKINKIRDQNAVHHNTERGNGVITLQNEDEVDVVDDTMFADLV